MNNQELQTIRQLKDELQALKKELKQYKERDALTGLYNRFAFQNMVESFLLQKERKVGAPAAFLMLDIDNFKQINDTLGHMQGDCILQKVADILTKTFQSPATARFGGDEYAVLVTNGTKKEICALAQSVCGQLNEIRFQNPRVPFVAASMGLAFIGDEKTDFYDLYKQADLALYKAKGKGKNTYAVYGA